jgi:cytochrome c2
LAGVGGAVANEKAEQRREARLQAARLTGGNADAGLAAIGRFGCGACHQIPGVPGASGQVGPSLKGIAGRSYLAGHLANDPPTLMRWIRFPQALEPGVVMPQMGVNEQEARDIAAYLYTLT